MYQQSYHEYYYDSLPSYHHQYGMSEQLLRFGPLSFNSQVTIGDDGDAIGHNSTRRVFSTGDLQAFSQHVMPETIHQQQQQKHQLPANSFDNSSQELNGGVGSVAAGRVGRYSPEERRERIERYRNKRNQRNFHKKITYACRKTLADRRPRVHGRFAKNEEPEMEFINANAEETMSYADWNLQTEATPTTMMAMAMEDEDDCDHPYHYDDELWNNFVDVFSMNNFIS